MAVVTLVLLTSLDPVTPAVLVAVELCLLPAAGLAAGRVLLRRTWPLLVGATSVAVVNVVLSGGDVLTGAGLALRVVGLALPGVLLVSSTDPVRLADALTVHWRGPPPSASGGLAAPRPGPAARCPGGALGGSHPVRLWRAGRAAAGPAAGRRARHHPARPPDPWHGGRPQPRGGAAARRRHGLRAAGGGGPPGVPAGRGHGRAGLRLGDPPLQRPRLPAAPPRRLVRGRHRAGLRRRGDPQRGLRRVGTGLRRWLTTTVRPCPAPGG